MRSTLCSEYTVSSERSGRGYNLVLLYIHVNNYPNLYISSELATLCELCPEDKRRVRQLVEQLAVVGAEKEQLEKQIFDDRHQFSDLLTKLKAHHQKVCAVMCV